MSTHRDRHPKPSSETMTKKTANSPSSKTVAPGNCECRTAKKVQTPKKQRAKEANNSCVSRWPTKQKENLFQFRQDYRRRDPDPANIRGPLQSDDGAFRPKKAALSLVKAEMREPTKHCHQRYRPRHGLRRC
jgi:hypothetical protein